MPTFPSAWYSLLLYHCGNLCTMFAATAASSNSTEHPPTRYRMSLPLLHLTTILLYTCDNPAHMIHASLIGLDMLVCCCSPVVRTYSISGRSSTNSSTSRMLANSCLRICTSCTFRMSCTICGLIIIACQGKAPHRSSVVAVVDPNNESIDRLPTGSRQHIPGTRQQIHGLFVPCLVPCFIVQKDSNPSAGTARKSIWFLLRAPRVKIQKYGIFSRHSTTIRRLDYSSIKCTGNTVTRMLCGLSVTIYCIP